MQISKDVIGFYDTVYDRGSQATTSEKKDAAVAVLKVFHESVSSPNLLCTTLRAMLYSLFIIFNKKLPAKL